jgi:hypothetical protein
MLYDKRWDRPRVADFADWLATKDPREEYDFLSPTHCAYAQFITERTGEQASIGVVPQPFKDIVLPLWGAGFWRYTWRRLTNQSSLRRKGWTFGDAHRRARASFGAS